jgi:hypothetical protein
MFGEQHRNIPREFVLEFVLEIELEIETWNLEFALGIVSVLSRVGHRVILSRSANEVGRYLEFENRHSNWNLEFGI